MAQAPPLTPPTRRARRPGRGNGEEQDAPAVLRSVAGMYHHHEQVSTRQRSPGGLIFGLIRLRSPTFIGVRSNVAMQVADVNGIWRTIIPSPENRKVGGSPPPLATTPQVEWLQQRSCQDHLSQYPRLWCDSLRTHQSLSAGNSNDESGCIRFTDDLQHPGGVLRSDLAS
jgi:hypothetical protein